MIRSGAAVTPPSGPRLPKVTASRWALFSRSSQPVASGERLRVARKANGAFEGAFEGALDGAFKVACDAASRT
jgi:hypothetical protein